jgi:hypothetical protein
MTNPQSPITVIVTQWITAQRLFEMRGHSPTPLFVSDGDERNDPDGGWRTTMSRVVSAAHAHGGSSIGGRQQIFVDFLDGTPGRLFDRDDMVEVHTIRPGRDLIEGFDS